MGGGMTGNWHPICQYHDPWDWCRRACVVTRDGGIETPNILIWVAHFLFWEGAARDGEAWDTRDNYSCLLTLLFLWTTSQEKFLPPRSGKEVFRKCMGVWQDRPPTSGYPYCWLPHLYLNPGELFYVRGRYF